MFPYTNVDVLYGMAGQSVDQLDSDLTAVVSLRTTTVDVYPVNNLSATSSMHQAVAEAKLALLPATTRLQYRLLLDRRFRGLGYAPISGYSFAIAEKERCCPLDPIQHSPQFLYHDILYGYQDDEIVGYGSSAITQMPTFNLYNCVNRHIYVNELLVKRALPHVSCGPIAAPERGIVSFPYRGVLEKDRVHWSEVPAETICALREALSAGLVGDAGERYYVTKLGWLFYVNLMYYLMPEVGRQWISNKIEQEERKGKRCEDTDLTDIIPFTAYFERILRE